ncbi:TMV resistance protein N-like [Quercus lobata]|uniref:TMV resistance protein N-like n=1 Tax=Quercus lobata TaxID=97700 RepID=UPI0012491155|nr:TMV resistance protein N-like [Quercus lobata]
MIKKRLSHKRILLVLDDVDESNKLKMLVRKSNWFGPGSIIIITTRNKQLLKEFPVDEIYEVKSLNYKDALRLFCSNAFKREPIPNEYLELTKDFLEYVGGLFLALEVLGSSLFGKSIDEWKNGLEMLKEHFEPAITRVLKVSYDGLQESMQEIFKDIACFFNHEDRDHVVKILNELGRYPLIGLSNLIDKSLLTISENNVLCMHDLVRDMCRNIVYQKSPNEPGKRSRLWDHKDINHVLKKNTGTEEVQAIDFKGAKDTSIYHEEKEACWGWVLSALPWEGLALLVTLREWIQWTLSSRGFTSSKKQKGPLWNPNTFLKMPNIKFMSETAIEELPSSVEFLIGLTLLNLNFCKNFVLLPSTICSLKSLESIYLWRCSKFDKLPRDLGNITSLKELGLSRTAIKEPPSSIEFLIGLTSLDLTNCKNFVLLPSTVCNLKSLEIMCLFRCPKFVNFPENFGNPKHLELLNFEGTAIEVLPSVRRLAALKILILKDCKILVCLPSTICNLKRVQYLDLTGCSKIANLLENRGNMESLTHLLLGGTAIKELPFSTIHLKWVYIVSFKVCQLSSSSLTSMPTITSAGLIDLSDCNLSAIPSGIVRILSAIPSGIDCRTGILCDLSLRGNDFVFLPESISQLSGLKRLYLDGCKSLRSLSNIRIPSKVDLICVNNCTSLERLPERPEPPNDFYWLSSAFYNKEFTVQCFNCFKLAYNIQNFSNMFQCVQEQFPPSENSWLLY